MLKPTTYDITRRMKSGFCRARLPSALSARETEKMRTYWLVLPRLSVRPARKGNGPDRAEIAAKRDV